MKRLPIWFTVAMSALAVVGWTLHWHLTIHNTNNGAAFSQPDGKLSSLQCASQNTGVLETQIVQRYGMPSGDNGNSNGTSDLTLGYPLRENSSRYCTFYFNGDNRVDNITIDLVNSTI